MSDGDELKEVQLRVPSLHGTDMDGHGKDLPTDASVVEDMQTASSKAEQLQGMVDRLGREYCKLKKQVSPLGSTEGSPRDVSLDLDMQKVTDQALKLQSQLQQLDDKLCAKFRQRNNTNEIQVRIPEESKPEEVVEEQKGDMQKYEEDTKKASATAVEVRDHLYQFVEKHAKMMESYRYLRQRVAELEGGPTLRIQSVSEVEADGLRKRIAELEAEAQDNQALQQRVEELEAQVRETDQLRKRVEELQELSRKETLASADLMSPHSMVASELELPSELGDLRSPSLSLSRGESICEPWARLEAERNEHLEQQTQWLQQKHDLQDKILELRKEIAVTKLKSAVNRVGKEAVHEKKPSSAPSSRKSSGEGNHMQTQVPKLSLKPKKQHSFQGPNHTTPRSNSLPGASPKLDEDQLLPLASPSTSKRGSPSVRPSPSRISAVLQIVQTEARFRGSIERNQLRAFRDFLQLKDTDYRRARRVLREKSAASNRVKMLANTSKPTTFAKGHRFSTDIDVSPAYRRTNSGVRTSARGKVSSPPPATTSTPSSVPIRRGSKDKDKTLPRVRSGAGITSRASPPGSRTDLTASGIARAKKRSSGTSASGGF